MFFKANDVESQRKSLIDPAIDDVSEGEISSKEELYEYPSPDDADAEFRKKCQEKFHFIFTYC